MAEISGLRKLIYALNDCDCHTETHREIVRRLAERTDALLTAIDQLATGVRFYYAGTLNGSCITCGHFHREPPDALHTPDCPVPLAEAVAKGELP